MAGTKRERSPGTWELTVTLGSDYKGKKKRFYKTVRGTEAEAEKELVLFYADCLRGNFAPGTEQTIEQIVQSYITDRPEGSLKANTLRGYQQDLDHRIAPYIGSLRLTKATPRTLQSWVDDMSSKYSPKTVHNSIGLLHAAFERLIKFGELDSNPCDRLTAPKNIRKEAESYTKEETALFIAALEQMPREKIVDKVAFELALFCGLRRGEILGLDWEDIDINNYTVRVRQTRYEGNEGLKRTDTPKTEKSRRTLSFPKAMRADLVTLYGLYSERKLIFGSEWYDSPALIRGVYGRPLSGADLLEHLHKFQKENGLRQLTLHQLRHTHISAMVRVGLDGKTIQEHAGHSTLSTTYNIYSHVFEEEGDQVAEEVYRSMK